MNNKNDIEFTFSDILLIPGKAAIEQAEESRIQIGSYLTKKIKLENPIVSANMASVTESDMAIVMARNGGIGIIHQFMPEEQQLKEVEKVKKKNFFVGAAVFSYGNNIKNQIKNLANSGCDVVVIDSPSAHNERVIKLVQEVKKSIKIELVVGNVVTKEATIDLIKAGVDGIKVGIGPGSHCTTRIVTGFGRPQLSAVIECAKAASQSGIPIIADGGITVYGDVVKALALGASSVMIGGLFAGTKESPGKLVRIKGRLFKKTWGNCTVEAYSWLKSGEKILGNVKQLVKRFLKYSDGKVFNDYFEEGVDAMTEYKGSVEPILKQISGAIRRGIWYSGKLNIKELQKNPHFSFISPSSDNEAKPRVLTA